MMNGKRFIVYGWPFQLTVGVSVVRCELIWGYLALAVLERAPPSGDQLFNDVYQLSKRNWDDIPTNDWLTDEQNLLELNYSLWCAMPANLDFPELAEMQSQNAMKNPLPELRLIWNSYRELGNRSHNSVRCYQQAKMHRGRNRSLILKQHCSFVEETSNDLQ